MSFLNKKNKKIKFYTVCPADKPQVFLTLTPTRKEALEYLNNLLRYKNNDHYERWLACRGLTDTSENWMKYSFDVIADESGKIEYNISEIKYTVSSLSSLMRMFIGCIPLGCSFENEMELDYFNFKLEQGENMKKNNNDISTNGEQVDGK